VEAISYGHGLPHLSDLTKQGYPAMKMVGRVLQRKFRQKQGRVIYKVGAVNGIWRGAGTPWKTGAAPVMTSKKPIYCIYIQTVSVTF
jgi:hypothetical protein